MDTLLLVIVAGVLALVYGGVTVQSLLALPAGNEKMKQIAGAIQEGAQAYLNRQYTTIAIAGAIVFALLLVAFGFNLLQPLGFAIEPYCPARPAISA
jgi:K(+)-stimulated pyrophosphate-energized sodium pump